MIFRILLLTTMIYVVAGGNAFAQHNDNPTEALFDAKHYEITLNNVDYDTKSLAGQCDIKIHAVATQSDVLVLDFISLIVDKVTIDGSEVSFTQNDTTVVIDMPDDYSENQDFDVSLTYHGTPFSEEWGGVHFDGGYIYNLGVGISTIPHNLARSWFPCIDNFSDKASFDYFITAKAGQKAVCGGVLVDSMVNDDMSVTYHWQSQLEIPVYSASFAIGDYAVIHDDYFSNLNGKMIPITYYVRPGDAYKIENMFVNIDTILNIYESYFGRYMFERIGFVGTGRGAMEHQNNIAFPNSAITNNTNYESLYAHELFHSWFGNNITCATAEDMWINEGWATYGAAFVLRKMYGKEIYNTLMETYRTMILNQAHTAAEDGDYYPLDSLPQSNTYGISSYNRGALVVHALHDYLSFDNDTLFYASVKDCIDRNKYKSLNSYDLMRELSISSGVDLSDFFHAFVLQPGANVYCVDSVNVEKVNNLYYADVYVRQELFHRNEYSDGNRIHVDFMDSAMNITSHKMTFDGQHGHQTFILNFNPVATFIDYHHDSYNATFDDFKMLTKKQEVGFSKEKFTLVVDEITDSTYFHISHLLCKPSGEMTNYRLSSTHHWKIDMLRYGDFHAKGVFTYSKSSLDDDFSDDNDTIVLLYRNNAKTSWHMLDTETIGHVSTGKIVVNTLQPGEYTFAVKDTTHYGINIIDKTRFDVFPNPSHDVFRIKTDINSEGYIFIYDNSGKLTDRLKIARGESFNEWKPGNSDSDFFIFVMKTDNGTRYSKKVLYTPTK